jgi:hypothetical protein
VLNEISNTGFESHPPTHRKQRSVSQRVVPSSPKPRPLNSNRNHNSLKSQNSEGKSSQPKKDSSAKHKRSIQRNWDPYFSNHHNEERKRESFKSNMSHRTPKSGNDSCSKSPINTSQKNHYESVQAYKSQSCNRESNAYKTVTVNTLGSENFLMGSEHFNSEHFNETTPFEKKPRKKLPGEVLQSEKMGPVSKGKTSDKSKISGSLNVFDVTKCGTDQSQRSLMKRLGGDFMAGLDAATNVSFVKYCTTEPSRPGQRSPPQYPERLPFQNNLINQRFQKSQETSITIFPQKPKFDETTIFIKNSELGKDKILNFLTTPKHPGSHQFYTQSSVNISKSENTLPGHDTFAESFIRKGTEMTLLERSSDLLSINRIEIDDQYNA